MIGFAGEMDLKTSSSFYLKLFYYLGLSPYHPTAQKGHLIGLAACLKFIQAAICITTGILSLYFLNAHDQLKNTEIIIVDFVVFCELSRGTCNLLQCMCFKQQLIEVMSIFDNLDLYFAAQLNHRICHRPFIKIFFRKFMLIFSFFVIYIISYVVRWFLHDGLGAASFILKVVQLIEIFNHLHIIFYIVALCFYMKQLNLVVKSDMLHDQDLSKPCILFHLHCRLKAYKNVHFRLWMASESVNRFFAFSLAPTVLYSFSTVIYSIYWLFQSFYDHLLLVTIWRKAMQMRLKRHFHDCGYKLLF